jgi:hypothetical protein
MTFFFLEAYLCTGHLVDPAGKPALYVFSLTDPSPSCRRTDGTYKSITELVFQIFNLIVNACALAWLSLFDFGRYQGNPDWWVFVVLFSLDGYVASFIS